MSRGTLLWLCGLGIVALFVAVFLVVDFDFSNQTVQQGAIAAVVVIAGWLVAFVFREASAEIERRQRQIDLTIAFRAEIVDYAEALADTNPARTADDLGSRILTAGDDPKTRWQPLFPRVSAPVVFGALSSEIPLLPEQTVDHVVQFYSMLSDITLFAEDLMSPAFVAGPAAGRAQAARDYIDMRNTASDLANAALAVLDLSLAQMRLKRRRWSVGHLTGTARHG